MKTKTYSILNRLYKNGDYHVCAWIQDHTGTLFTAMDIAIETSAVNDHKLDIIITDKIESVTPELNHHVIKDDQVLVDINNI